MTSQSISELSSFFTGSVGTQAASKMKGNDQSFSGLMNRETQTDKNAPAEDMSKAAPRKTTEVRKPDQVKEISKADRPKKIEASDDTTKAMDQTKEIADQIAGELKQVLDVTEEDISAAMETLGLTILDLVDPNALQQLFTELSGAQDGMALLTDETLYGQLNQVMQTAEELLDGLKEELGLNDEEFESLMTQIRELPTEAADTDTKLVNRDKREEIPVTVEDERVLQTADESIDSGVKAATQVSKDEKPSAHTDNGSEEAQSQLGSSQFSQTTSNVAEAITEAVDRSSFASYVDTQEITNQVIDQVKVRITEETTSMEMQLNPESLGKLNLSVESRNGIVTAQITAQEEAVKVAIEGQIELLKQTLEEQGLKIEAVEVSVAAHEFEQNLEQGRDQAQQEDEAKTVAVGGRKRSSINLLSDEEEENEEELDEADELNRDMMIRNGNTVDYTA